MNVLDVNNISKQFGDFVAVENVSFSIDEGVVFGLIGPNGAGKTTTIRMIMNIIIPDTGTVSVLGDHDMRTAIDRIGYLPEERGMYRKMKVKDLLRFLAELKSMSRRDAAVAIDYWLERVSLKEWQNKKIEELSKGMQQKIQFIGTVLHNPKLLILDEPFGGLDPVNQNLIKDILMELKKDGMTIIFSTHVMESAEKLCEEIFMINKSRKVFYGKLADIKNEYGKRNILIEYDGDDAFLNSPEILTKDNYGNMAEIQLKKEGDSQKVLRQALSGATIRKFEIKEPSLHDIFINTVGQEARKEAGNER
ncbi:ATP-binding cassette domain-containing protein [bacterium]|nr:ATP-binding cassette domain-containing protein [bacterium]